MADFDQENDPRRPGTSTVGRLLITGFLGAVVAAECLFAYLWLPSADQVAAQVEQMAKDAKSAAEATPEDAAKETASVVEVDLGTFSVTNHRLPTESTFRTDFHLYGTVADDDRSEFAELFKRNEYRFRDQVIVEIRNSEISDLEDPGLGLIKRRFLAKSNALFGKPLLRSVIFADYTFVEL